MREVSWFEVEIPRDDAFKVVADSFLRDYCAAHIALKYPVTEIHHVQTLSGDKYFLSPEAARVYFFEQSRSALADWLMAIRLARPCEPPEVSDMRRLPC